jgi:hypothetical protein
MILSYEVIIRTLERLFVIVGLSLFIVIITQSYMVKDVDTFTTETEIYNTALLYSKAGISFYHPEIERLYPGIIDVSKFTTDTTTNLFPDRNHLSGVIILNATDGSMIKRIVVDSDRYKRWKPLTSYEGPGATRKSVRVHRVQYIDNGWYTPKTGYLTVEWVMKNHR